MNYATNMKSVLKKQKKITLAPYSNLSGAQTSESSYKEHRVGDGLATAVPVLVGVTPAPCAL